MSASLPPPEIAVGRKLWLIERSGQVCLTVWIAALVILGVFWEEPYAKVWQLVIGQVAGGRALSVSRGMQLGFSRWFLFFQCSMQDIIILLLLYPFFIAGYRKAIEFSFIGRTIVNIRATAELHKEKVRPWGAVGLIAFVIFPFWSTGALAGGVVGYLIGLPMWLTFFAVITGNFIAVGLWILLFQQMRDLSEALADSVPLVIVAILAVTLVVTYVRKRLKRRSGALAQSVPETDPAAGEDETSPQEPGRPAVRIRLGKDIDPQS